MTPPLFFVPAAALAQQQVVIDGDEGRHAATVRRLRVGEQVDVGDGAGSLVRGKVAEVTRGTVVVDVLERRAVSRPAPSFVVAQALARGGRDEDAIEAMTEIGVDEVLGWQATRSVARWTDGTMRKWRSRMREAAKQSRRAWIPDVSGPVSTSDLAERVRTAALAVVLHEHADQPLVDVALPDDGAVVVVVGPEGGVADEELAVLSAAGAELCRLGPHVLRSSTAGVAALSVLSAAGRWRLTR